MTALNVTHYCLSTTHYVNLSFASAKGLHLKNTISLCGFHFSAPHTMCAYRLGIKIVSYDLVKAVK